MASFRGTTRLYQHRLRDDLTNGRTVRGGMADGGKGRTVRWSLAGLLVLGMMTVLLPMLQAQEEDGGGAAFAGGQMVRGTVASVGTDSLEVKTLTGETVKVAITNNTRMMKARQPVKLAEIKPGDGVGAVGVAEGSGKTVHAAMLFVMDAEQVRKAKEDLGKTYITGRVVAMNEVKLTIKRPDGVSQVIQVDEGTSFKRAKRGSAVDGSGGAGEGSESITLADVKVGDMVFGKGGLKNGVFAPTELGVMDAATAGRRRRSGADADAAGAR